MSDREANTYIIMAVTILALIASRLMGAHDVLTMILLCVLVGEFVYKALEK